MKRIFAIIGWGILSFLVAHMALAFAAGFIFAVLISFGVDHQIVPRVAGLVTLGIAIATAVAIMLFGVRGRLPGTK